MLTIRTAGKTYEWHVGEPKFKVLGTIYDLHADGDELDYLKTRLVITRTDRVIVYYGHDVCSLIWDQVEDKNAG